MHDLVYLFLGLEIALIGVYRWMRRYGPLKDLHKEDNEQTWND